MKVAVAVKDPNLMTRIEISLDEAGYEVQPFQSAGQIWSFFPEKRPRIIITERRFKDEFKAVELCRKIRAQYELPYVYIIVLSHMSRYKEIDEAISAGADDYLVKPFNPFQIRARLRVAMKWISYIDSITLTT